MDDDEKDGAKRAETTHQSKKSIEDVLKRVARPAWRSRLFCWLVEHHDALRQNEAETGRGVPWRELCVEFVGLGITLADGRPVKPATARITWQRVRKELVRVEERRARERAEREARRAADPRRDMPSRINGPMAPPLADRQPPRVAPRPVAPPFAAATGAVASSPLPERAGVPAEMPGGPVLTGGIEETLPASEFTIIFEGEPLDLRLFIGPNDKRPWDLPEFSAEDRIRVLKAHLKMRFDAWKRDRVRSPYNRVDMEWRKRLGKS
jgi:hypothetical protein